MKHETMRRGALALSAMGGLALAGAAWAHDDKFKMMDGNGDGAIPAAEHAAGAKAMFERMDADHDGYVTAAEMDAGHAAMDRDDDMHGMKAGEKAGKEMGHDMHDMDHGKDRDMGHGKGMSPADMVAKMDTDGDGRLSAAEHEAGAAAMFKDMDSNGDGSLSRSEMEAGHARMMKMKKPAEKPAAPASGT